MRVVSVNVGLPRTVLWQGREVTTAIFKKPVEGRVALRATNLEGDRQADPTVHGGPEKAVYAYPVEHYARWRRELPDLELPPQLAGIPLGSFGENLTVEGLPLEDEIAVGDRYRIGSAELTVTQPRLPCYKLGLRFQRVDMVKRFLASGRTGWYFSVAREGSVAAGDPVELLERHPAGIAVSAVTRAYAVERHDAPALALLAELEPLPADWRKHFAKQLAALA